MLLIPFNILCRRSSAIFQISANFQISRVHILWSSSVANQIYFDGLAFDNQMCFSVWLLELEQYLIEQTN